MLAAIGGARGDLVGRSGLVPGPMDILNLDEQAPLYALGMERACVPPFEGFELVEDFPLVDTTWTILIDERLVVMTDRQATPPYNGDIQPETLRICDDRRAPEVAPPIVSGAGFPGDTNADGRVDSADYANFVAQFGGAPGENSADFDHSGFVDLTDLSILRENFGATMAANPTPEPASMSLLAISAATVLTRCRRRA